jgi:hypothetical protein
LANDRKHPLYLAEFLWVVQAFHDLHAYIGLLKQLAMRGDPFQRIGIACANQQHVGILMVQSVEQIIPDIVHPIDLTLSYLQNGLQGIQPDGIVGGSQVVEGFLCVFVHPCLQ